jgi:hypothetical protein
MMHRNRISIYVFVLSHQDLFRPIIIFLIFGNKNYSVRSNTDRQYKELRPFVHV